MDHEPIVSLAGEEDLHRRAESYNRRLVVFRAAQDDLERAIHWNRRERFGVGFLAQAQPPVSTHAIEERIALIGSSLTVERAEIVRLGNGTVKP